MLAVFRCSKSLSLRGRATLPLPASTSCLLISRLPPLAFFNSFNDFVLYLFLLFLGQSEILATPLYCLLPSPNPGEGHLLSTGIGRKAFRYRSATGIFSPTSA